VAGRAAASALALGSAGNASASEHRSLAIYASQGEMSQSTPLVHAFIRGHRSAKVALDEDDRARFVAALEASGLACLAWTLADDHFELVAHGAPPAVRRAVGELCTAYARDFNERHARRGYLFEDDPRIDALFPREARALVCELHLAPVWAASEASAAELLAHRWSSLGGLLGKRGPLGFERPELVCELFGMDRDELRAALLDAVERAERDALDLELPS